MFSCEFCETFMNTFFTEHLLWLLLALQTSNKNSIQLFYKTPLNRCNFKHKISANTSTKKESKTLE